MSRRRLCPRCSGSGTPIVYGYPDEELIEAAARGEVDIGGCVVPVDVEMFTCPQCRELWGAAASDQDVGPHLS
jgi:hypothetical protein